MSLGKKHIRSNAPYKSGELEVILSLPPTQQNIEWLSVLLERAENAIEIVYKIAYEHGPFGKEIGIQERKIIQAKNKIGIKIGHKKSRKT